MGCRAAGLAVGALAAADEAGLALAVVAASRVCAAYSCGVVAAVLPAVFLEGFSKQVGVLDLA